MNEREWQSKVLELATYCGWLSYHPFDSRRSTAGWPDLALCRDGRLVLAELKTERGRISPEQRQWLAELSAVPGLEVYCWRPSDWTKVQSVLRRDPLRMTSGEAPSSGRRSSIPPWAAS